MANLKYGSSGDDVKKLQEALGFTGADVDGQFGKKTQQAVIDYKKANNLGADGIVDEKTWGKLTNLNPGDTGVGLNPVTPSVQTQSVTQQPQTGAEPQNTGGFTYGAYEKSDAVKQAEALLQQQLAQKPGAYTSTWQGQLDEIINRIMNREDFSYDLNGDALYQQLKDQYAMQGDMAMMDTMGQAAAITGGYGSSYAQGVGQQTYQGYLQQLNDRVPELYGMALDRYNLEGQNLYDQASLMAGMEDQAYGRYQDSLNAYYAELDRLAEDARYQSEQDYGRWADSINLGYGMYRDQVSDAQWQAQFDEAKRQWEYANGISSGDSTIGSVDGNTGGDDGKPGGKYTPNPGWDEEKIKAFQEAHGIKVDGKWGPETAAEYDKDPGWVNVGELSAAGKNFMDNLPYAPGGMADGGRKWKNYVDSLLKAQYESGMLSESDVIIIVRQLGLN